MLLGAHIRLPGGPLAWAVRLPRTTRAEKEVRSEAMRILEENGLAWAADLPADELSHGLHKGVELCRALLMRPKLLLLDEPAAGLPALRGGAAHHHGAPASGRPTSRSWSWSTTWA